jgi:hypothetical protein
MDLSIHECALGAIRQVVNSSTRKFVDDLVDVSGIGPGGKAGHRFELLKEPTHDLVGIGGGAQAIELRHHRRQRALDFTDRALRVVLALRIQTALAFDELFSVEIREGMEDGIRLRPRVGQEACDPVPWDRHGL